jgi:hypothetical protein
MIFAAILPQAMGQRSYLKLQKVGKRLAELEHSVRTPRRYGGDRALLAHVPDRLILPSKPLESLLLLQNFHWNWASVSYDGRRDYFEDFGALLGPPDVDAFITYTMCPGGSPIKVLMKIAEEHLIPTFNLARPEDSTALRDFLERSKIENAKG